MEGLFPPDYRTARERFREAGHRAGFEVFSYPVPVNGVTDIDLTVDVACAGRRSARRAVVISSGIHGIEGFLGSAVQLGVIRSPWPADTRVVLVHALNPFGFHHLRRVNEHNIDLNRNFVLDGYAGAPDQYREIERGLNLAGAPHLGDLFLARLAVGVLRYGNAAIRDAIAGGQYLDNRGLFYGGVALAQVGDLLRSHMVGWLGDADRVLHVDIHTGLGAWGSYKLIVDHGRSSARFRWLAERFGADRVEPADPEGVSYHRRGGLGPWCTALVHPREYDLLIAEFGTYPAAVVLMAMRNENQTWHWHGSSDVRSRLARAFLREVFAPASRRWRQGVMAHARALIHRILDVCRSDGASADDREKYSDQVV